MLSRILRPLSIGTAALIAGLSILGCVAMRTSVASERTRILDERAAAVTYLIEATFQEQLASLKELGAVAAADPGDAQQTLTAGAKPFLAGEQAFVAVVRPTARGYRIEGVVGGGQQVGSILTGKAHLTLADAGAHSLTGASMVVPTRSGPVMGIAVPIAGRVVFVESAIDPTPVSTVASPFSDLRGALYAAPTDRPSSLVFTNDANLPIVGNPSSRTAFLVGDNEWSMYLTARGDLVGWWTAALPWLVLGAGLALATLLTIVIETLTRRRRYAEDLADQRTESLASANQELGEARLFINRLVSTGPLVMMVLDSADGTASYVSPNIEQRFGISEADTVEADFVARHVDPVDATGVRDALRFAASEPEGVATTMEFRLRMGAGESRWVEAVIVPARSAQVPDGSVFVYALDIDDRHHAAEVREAAQAAADAANRSKSEFLSRMSHELRTPLNAILGYAQILEIEGLQQEQSQPVQQIMSSGRHLLALINEVLDISRIESGRLSMSVEPVDVAEVLDIAVNMVRPAADERGVSLFVTDDGQVRTVMADRQRLQQVLLNLLTNAVKYNRPNGSVTVSSRQEADGVARIFVSDTGLGFDDDERDQVFAPFQRLEKHAGEVEGTGIGLTLSRHLMDAMGGVIDVDSEVGQGSTFWIELPAAEPTEVEGDVIAAIPGMPAERADESFQRTVLQIEDNPANFRLVERVLGRAFGVRLLTATTAAEGIALARQHQPDLILLDLHLPDAPGDAVLASLQGNPATAGISVVVISADATPSTLERLKAEGASEYLTKPIDVRQLLDIVQATGVSR